MKRFAALPPALLLFLIVGCGGDGNQISAEQRDKAEKALQNGLNAWKNGEPAKKWLDKAAAVQFHDHQWKEGYQLVDYRIETVRGSKEGRPEALVALTVQKGKNKPLTQQVLYAVYLTNQTIVARDPMY